MKILRIVANLAVSDPQASAAFYCELLGLDVLMDSGFICTVGSDGRAPIQLSLASEGGSGTPVPALSIEVDDLNTVLARALTMKCAVTYGPVTEPWGVRRFYLQDPDGHIINILTHL